MKKKTNFTLILNHLKVNCKLPVEIIPSHFFQKASIQQIKRIKNSLEKINTLGNALIPYEYKTMQQTKTSWSFKPLPQKHWKYYIIQFAGHNDKLYDLRLISNLSGPELKYGFTFLGTSGIMVNPISIVNYIAATRPHETTTITTKDINELKTNYSKLKEIEEKYPDIKRSIEFFDSLNLIPKASKFHILGLFITIESLLTHKPDPKDPSDSLGRQITSKIPLVNNRADRAIKCLNFFQSIREENLWKKLYKYRSLIAHGEKIEFSGDLGIFKNDRNIYDYLNQITKMLLRQAIREPQLLHDLKQC